MNGWLLVTGLLLMPAAQAVQKIVIGAETQAPPFSYLDENQQLKGITVEIIASIYNQHPQYQVQLEPLPFIRCLSDVQAGLIDGCFHTPITRQNQHSFKWSRQAVASDNVVFLMPASSSKTYTQHSDLYQLNVGAVLGYIYPPAFEDDANIKKFLVSTDGNLLKMLANERIDIAPIFERLAAIELKQQPALTKQLKRVGEMSVLNMYIAFNKDKAYLDDFIKNFDSEFEQIKKTSQWRVWQRAAEYQLPKEISQ